MKIIKVKLGDAFDISLAYRTLKKIGVRGQMNLDRVQDFMLDYVYPEKRTRYGGSQKKYDVKRANELQKAFGHFGVVAGNSIFSGLSKDELRKMFLAMSTVVPNKVSASFTHGLDIVEVK